MAEGEAAKAIDEARRQRRDDEKLLRRAEKVLTEIKVAQGLANEHASVLAALRIRLKGDAGKKLEDLLEAADGPAAPGPSEYRPPGALHEPPLRWVGKPGADHRSWVERFERAGLVEGAATMTNVQHLAVLWKAERRTWLLQLSTLAGALIG